VGILNKICSSNKELHPFIFWCRTKHNVTLEEWVQFVEQDFIADRSREVLIVVSITSDTRVRLEELTIVSNMFGMSNMSSRVSGDLLNVGSTKVVDMPVTLDLFSNLTSYYTFFGTVIASNLRGGECNAFDILEIEVYGAP
jgi:hypothetical protein